MSKRTHVHDSPRSRAERKRTHARRNDGSRSGAGRHGKGALPGNANAVRHGLYAVRKSWRETPPGIEILDPSSALPWRSGSGSPDGLGGVTGLQSDMDLLRCCLDRYLDSLDAETADSASNRDILFTVGFAAARLVSLTRVQQRAFLLSASTAELSRILQLLPPEHET